MQWHTPIGYCVREGQIVVDERQSEIVKQIFADYDKGISASQIAHTLMEQGVMNKHDRVKWTHATVGRILENHNYLGTEYYPSFIDKEMFHRVQEKREQKRQNSCSGIYRPEREERILFSGVIKCGTCGAVYGHHTQKKGRTKQEPKWKCRNYVYHNQLCCAGGFISDREVMEVCVKVINQILQDRELIQNVPEEQNMVTPRYQELDNMVKRMGDGGYDEVSMLLLDRASERYLTLNVRDTDERTKFMLEAISEMSEIKEFDEDLYRKLIKEIFVHKNSIVTVVFYNGSRLTTEYGQKTNDSVYIRKGVGDGN